jgi:mannose-6-phosphate isomerase-like protein (cupin superfamily)
MKIIRAADKSFIPASHENPLAPGVWKKVLFQRDGLQPGTVQMVNWARLPAGSSFSAHYHEDMQEIFIIVAGEAEMAVSGETVVLGRGDTIAIDPAEIHRMTNRGSEDVEYVVLGITGNRGGKTVVVATPEGS